MRPPQSGPFAAVAGPVIAITFRAARFGDSGGTKQQLDGEAKVDMATTHAGRPRRSGAGRRATRDLTVLLLTGFMAAVGAVGWAGLASAALPPVPVPVENPLTPAKAVLGKILFWDQQLSTDNTVACGSCHAPAFGGMDPVLAVHPGADGLFGNADDVSGSFGVVRRGTDGMPKSDPLFGLARQVTDRAPPNFFGGLWASENFWDGRAGDSFLDPLTGSVAIATGGALENQALGPILSEVEMAKEGRTWSDVVERLEFAPPLGLATSWPADVSAAIALDPTYPDLFDAAFGDPAITPVRIAFAIASYERTLVPDQTAWDAFDAGDSEALTPQEQQGLQFLEILNCNDCHPPPTFSDDTFRTLGLRSPSEDDGRQSVTGDPDDRGAFKTPTLRNSGLKPSFMHTGELTTLAEVMTFYGDGLAQDPENLDPLMPIDIAPSIADSFVAFIENGLTDPRVANETAPFDRPILAPEPGFASGLAIAIASLAQLVGTAGGAPGRTGRGRSAARRRAA